MSCTPDAVDFKDNGEYIYFKKTDCSLVKHWATKYDAKEKMEWIPEVSGTLVGEPELSDPDVEHIISIVPGPELRKGDTVWAVPSSTMGASSDASLIERLVSTASAKDYEEIRRNLSEAGYPDDVLDAAPTPR